MARCVRIQQVGTQLVRPPDGWAPFTATQVVACGAPGFVWDAVLEAGPGKALYARNALVEGIGSLETRLNGLWPLGSKIDAAVGTQEALCRYLREALWYPTALLPSRGVVWSPIDAVSARAGLRSGDQEIQLDFHFGSNGLVNRIHATAGAAISTPWQARFFHYAQRAGGRILLRCRMEWLLPRGPQVYWRCRIQSLVCAL